MTRRQRNELATGLEKERVLPNKEHPGALLNDGSKGNFEIAVARRRHYEQLLSDRRRGALQVSQFLQRIRPPLLHRRRCCDFTALTVDRIGCWISLIRQPSR